jgi:hypothetical protein
MRTQTLVVVAAVALIVSAKSQVRADQISWSYGFSLSSTSIKSNESSDSISITPLSGTLTGTLPTAATITAVNLQTIANASAKDPAVFSNAEYTLTMRLTDLSSGLTAAVTFEGMLNGTLSASGASLTNEFVGQKTFSFNLNHHIYDISIGSFTAPGSPGSGDLGSIDVNVSIHHNPEPSSFLLGALGLPAFGFMARRWRRQEGVKSHLSADDGRVSG